MKRTTLAMGTLLLAMTAALASPAMARDEWRGNGHGRGHERGYDRGHDRHGDRHDRGRGHDYGYRDDDGRRGNDRYGGRYDDRRHYRVAPRYPVHYAPRPVVRYGGPGYYAPPRWARGQYYHGPGYGPTYVVHEYRPYGLRAPPRGYYWRRSDAGDFLLVAAATGIIADLILHR